MKQLLFARFLSNRQYKLPACLLIFALIFSSVTLAYDVEGYKNLPTPANKTAQPSIGKQAYCECNCVKGKWVCTGAGCDLTGACTGSIESSAVPLNSRTIPAITDPRLTDPTPQIDPQTLPGDAFDPKALPGDAFKQ